MLPTRVDDKSKRSIAVDLTTTTTMYNNTKTFGGFFNFNITVDFQLYLAIYILLCIIDYNFSIIHCILKY